MDLHEQEFLDLLNLYLQRQETPEQRDRLMALMRTGRYNDLIPTADESTITENDADIKLNPASNQHIFNTLQQQYQAQQPTRRRTFSPWWMAAAAVIIIFAVGIGAYIKMPHATATVAAATDSLVIFKDKQFVAMPDGTKVFLSAGSELSYHAQAFGTTVREVTLTGQAYFDVAHDEAHAFIVKTANATTTVLGTAFNVDSRGTETIVVVARGKVKVEDNHGHSGLITKNQRIAVKADTQTLAQDNTDSNVATAWVEEYVSLVELPLAQVIPIINKHYGVNIILQNPAMGNCIVRVPLSGAVSLNETLTILQDILGFEYTRDPAGDISVNGPGC